MESYKRVIHKTKSDLVGDVLTALTDLRRTSAIPDDAKIVSLFIDSFSKPKTIQITVEWQDDTLEREIYLGPKNGDDTATESTA